MKDMQITRLKGPDRVRKRPAVIFGTDGLEGVKHGVRSLLEVFVTEARLGCCTHIRVRRKGAVLEISGDDRGFYLGQDTGDDTVWQDIFCDFSAGEKFAPDESGWSLGLLDADHHRLYGDAPGEMPLGMPPGLLLLELCAIQCASEFMEVRVCRQGVESLLRFEKGYNAGGIRHTPTDKPDGTTICLKPDGEVFTRTVLPHRFFEDTLSMYAVLLPGLRCTYERERGEKREFYYPEGIVEYAQKGAVCPVFESTLEARGRDRYNRAEYAARVQISVGITPDSGKTLCCHNFRPLTGGTHYRRMLAQLCEEINVFFLRGETAEKPITWRELSRHLTVVLATVCSPRCTDWESSRQTSIRNPLIEDMTEDAFKDFANYVYTHRQQLQPVVETIRKERK